MIIDSHIHLWNESIANADWLTDAATDPLRRPFTLTDYADAVAGSSIESAVVVTAEQTSRESRRLIDECAGSQLVAGIVGWVDLASATDEPLDGLVGVRHSVISESEGWLDRSDIRRGVGRFARSGLVLELLVGSRDLPAVLRCADANPELSIVIDHLGSPPALDDDWAQWEVSVVSLGRRANVRFKLSGPRLDEPSIELALGAIGPGRLMFGSNWPVSLLSTTFHDEIEQYCDITSALSPNEQEQIGRMTAIETYGLAR